MIGEAEIHHFTSETWANVLGLDLEPSGRAFEPTSDTITGCVQVTGGWQGTVVLVCPVLLARKVTSVMMGLTPDEVTLDHQTEGIGELTKILGGNIKSLLPGPSYLSLPAVAQGSSYAVRIPGGVCVADGVFECEGETFMIAIVEAAESPFKIRAEVECAACV